MTVTDIFVLAALFLLGFTGALAGFFRSLVMPTALLASIAAGSIAFSITRNILWSMLSSSGTFFILRWVLSSLINQPSESTPQPMNPLNRIGGCLVNLTWGSAFALLLVAILALCPFGNLGLGDITNDVTRSKTYAMILPLVIIQGGTPDKPAPCPEDACSKAPQEVQALMAEPALQEILNDPRIKAMLASPELERAARTQDIQAILANPTVAELQRDPAFLIKVFRAYSTLQAKMPPSTPQ